MSIAIYNTILIVYAIILAIQVKRMMDLYYTNPLEFDIHDKMVKVMKSTLVLFVSTIIMIVVLSSMNAYCSWKVCL